MRTIAATIAVAGTLLAALGVYLDTSWMILVGGAALVFAIVVGALTGSAVRRRRPGRSRPTDR